jgi:signal transduction histidine kinase
MKKLTLTLFLALIGSVGFAQETKIYSIKLGLEKAKTDSAPYNTCISDNGPGIPSSIKDKIFQPFFTTKKGTEGTGLGLSLSYDIIKAHGGELKVETKEGVGTDFSIILPIQNHI